MIALPDLAVAVVLGAALGLGVCLALAPLPRWGAPRLARRVAVYLPDAVGGASMPERVVVHSVWVRAARGVAGVLGGAEGVERRLAQAGRRVDGVALRGRQLAAGVVGIAAGGIVVVGLALAGRGSSAVWLLPPLCAVAGAVLVDAELTRAARARVGRIQGELPTVLEFLALCLSAGEGLPDALRRVAGIPSGELSEEFRAVVLSVGTGSTLPDALAALSRRLQLPPLARAIDQLVAAIERGAPLAQVLHAHAADAREDAKRLLLERAGRKEILMLLPLVFLILPLSVLFAVFPGIVMLRFGLG